MRLAKSQSIYEISVPEEMLDDEAPDQSPIVIQMKKSRPEIIVKASRERIGND